MLPADAVEAVRRIVRSPWYFIASTIVPYVLVLIGVAAVARQRAADTAELQRARAALHACEARP